MQQSFERESWILSELDGCPILRALGLLGVQQFPPENMVEQSAVCSGGIIVDGHVFCHVYPCTGISASGHSNDIDYDIIVETMIS